jgi:sugar lactone lactonase YvrE
MTTSLVPRAVLACAASVAVAGGLVPAAQADAPPPATNDLVATLTFGSGDLGDAVAVHRTPSGDVLVADDHNDVIARFAADGTFKGTFGASASGTAFNDPEDITTDGAGNIYVGDFQHGRVVKFDANGTFLTSITGAPAHQIGSPGGVTVHGSILYVADSQANDIKTFSLTGAFKSSFGGPGTGPGEFTTPFGVGVADDGDVYVADGNGQRVEVFDASGAYKSQFGSPGSGPGQFRAPTGLSLDGAGNVFVGDSLNNRVQKFSPGGDFLGQFGPLDGKTLVLDVSPDGAGGAYATNDVPGPPQSASVTLYRPRGEATTADGVTSTSADLHGIVRPGGNATTYSFRWHRAGHGTWHPLGDHVATGTDPVAVDAVVDGLAASRDYVFRIRVQKAGGTAYVSNDVPFTTAAAPPPQVGDIGQPEITFTGDTARVRVPITGHGGQSTVRIAYWRDGGPLNIASLHSTDPLTATTREFTTTFRVVAGAHYTHTIRLRNAADGPVESDPFEFTTP